jgi:hypothetical protein
MGTTVFPDALVKIYLTASDEERARRRWLEQTERGDAAPFEQVLAEQKERDRQDREREASPLRRAPDAKVVDSTGLTLEQVIHEMEAVVRGALQGAGEDAAPSGEETARSGAPSGEEEANGGATAGQDKGRDKRLELGQRIRELEQKLSEREDALPAHSVRPHQLAELEELEAQIAVLRAELENDLEKRS